MKVWHFVLIWLGWIAFLLSLIITIMVGNFWFTEPGVLREAKFINSQSASIAKVNRNLWSDSVIIVDNDDGSRSVYSLDTNILFNYELKEAGNGI